MVCVGDCEGSIGCCGVLCGQKRIAGGDCWQDRKGEKNVWATVLVEWLWCGVWVVVVKFCGVV